MSEQEKQRIFAEIQSLPADQQSEAVINLLGVAINAMTTAELTAMKEDIESTFSAELKDLAIVRESLEVIDGALALREMEKGE